MSHIPRSARQDSTIAAVLMMPMVMATALLGGRNLLPWHDAHVRPRSFVLWAE